MTLTVVHNTPICSFNADWLAPTVNQYLEFVPWDSQKTYAPGTLFYMNSSEFSQPAGYDFCDQLNNQGFRVIVDNLWEVNPGPIPGALRICCDRWFWYNESLWYQHLALDQYQPQRDFQYRALMPMNRRKPHRDDFAKRISLDNMLWSYVEAGRQLPNDKDMTDWNTQRYMNPQWYDSTYLSMVVETIVRPGSKYTPVFVTEKTMKPVAFQHPFVVYGNRGTLRTLREWGFETWNHLWDESYDEIVAPEARRDAVINVINNIEIQNHSAYTQEKLTHNKNRFFDRDLVIQGIKKEIMEPIVEYAES